MNNLTPKRRTIEDKVEACVDISEKKCENVRKQRTQNEVGVQENDELFVIDVTGEQNNVANNCESDKDESDNSRNAPDDLFKVGTGGQEGEDEDSDSEYDSDDNCVIGKIIFINFLMCMAYCLLHSTHVGQR